MKRCTAVNLDTLIKDFGQLEQKITELNGKNSSLEIRLDETSRLLNFSQSRERCLTEERNGLLVTVCRLQQTVQHQCDLREENQKLKNAVHDMMKQNEAQKEESDAQVKTLEADMKALKEHHQEALNKFEKEAQRKLQEKDTEFRDALARAQSTSEEIKKRLREQEREKQTEVIKLQMEFSAKLARAHSTSASAQQQPQGSSSLPQNIYKRKLQFIQEEKDKEIEGLQRRVKELEQQSLHGFTESCLKRRRM